MCGCSMRIVFNLFIIFVVFLNFPLFLMASDAYFIYDSKAKRDPFISLLGKNIKLTDVELLESVDDIIVEGVVVDPDGGSTAILNGKILKISEFIGGFRLDKVTHYEVYLSRDGVQYKIKFRERTYE